MTLLCVSIMAADAESTLADAKAAALAGADLVEYRIDEVFSGSTSEAEGGLDADEVRLIERIVAESPLPCIVTCRAAAEAGGTGGYTGDEMARVSLIERLGAAAPSGAGPAYIDFEHASYTRSANIRQKINLAVRHPGQVRDVGTSLILSTHDFTGRPGDLLRRVSAMQGEPAASVVKVAFMARSIRDNLELFDLLGESQKPTIALGMGRFGLMSRVLAPKFKGFLTFASLRAASATAPGQPTVGELLGTYRFRSITPRTRVFGVVGWPVEQSLSPHVHNAGFEAAGFDGVFLPLPVPPEWEHFKATLSALIDHPRLDFAGCAVTIPHKQHLVRFARERAAAGEPWTCDELSELCGAGNTLVVERSRGHRVLNTDAPAACECLRQALGTLSGKRIGLLGAGGVARAIAGGLMREGTRVIVFNRTPENAAALVAELSSAPTKLGWSGVISASGLETQAVLDAACDALVNCTPLGMTGGPDPAASAVPAAELARANPETVVMDTVYKPLETPTLRACREAGLRTIDGLGMFVRQAGLQFEAWTGAAPPASLFERVAREAVSGHNGGS